MIYKGRFNQIEQGEISCNDLALLADNLIKRDCVNFDIENVGLGFTSTLINSLIKYIPEDKNTNILIINGITLELYNILKGKGYNNITLAFGSWNKEKQKYIDSDKDTFEIMREYIQNNFEDDINVIKLEEIFDMGKKFDLIISNPPYAIGNEITKAIIDNVEFDQFVNLMPISDYKKKDLYKNISKVCEGMEWEGDAMVHPFICLLSKNKDKDKSWDNIQLVTYNQKWIKYYKEQLKREASWKSSYRNEAEHPIERTFYLTLRTGVDGVHKTEDCFDYKYNVLESYSDNELPAQGSTGSQGIFSCFETTTEKRNICNYWYNSQIMSSIVKGLNKQSLSNANMFLPKVDWTHPWTDKEILRDYGYTDEEIKEILG